MPDPATASGPPPSLGLDMVRPHRYRGTMLARLQRPPSHTLATSLAKGGSCHAPDTRCAPRQAASVSREVLTPAYRQ